MKRGPQQPHNTQQQSQQGAVAKQEEGRNKERNTPTVEEGHSKRKDPLTFKLKSIR
jgi:hypothetical protein